MRHLKSLLTAALVGAAALLAGEASAQVSERTLRWAQQNSLEHPQGQGAKKFAELVEQKSGGKIKVRVFPSGQLGGDLQNVSALQGGTLDLMVLNAGLLVGVVKEFAVFDLPFQFNTPQEADAVADGPVGKKLFDKLPEKGLVGLGYFELGFRNVTNSKRPIAKLEDPRGSSCGCSNRPCSSTCSIHWEPTRSRCPSRRCTPPWNRRSSTGMKTRSR